MFWYHTVSLEAACSVSVGTDPFVDGKYGTNGCQTIDVTGAVQGIETHHILSLRMFNRRTKNKTIWNVNWLKVWQSMFSQNIKSIYLKKNKKKHKDTFTVFYTVNLLSRFLVVWKAYQMSFKGDLLSWILVLTGWHYHQREIVRGIIASCCLANLDKRADNDVSEEQETLLTKTTGWQNKRTHFYICLTSKKSESGYALVDSMNLIGQLKSMLTV